MCFFGLNSNEKVMNTRIIELLNAAVKDELSAIHQYLYFHFHCEDQRLNWAATIYKKTAVEEMQHVARLSERILFLKGDVNMTLSQPIKSVKEIKAMLNLSSEMELASARDYNTWARECTENNDAISRQLLESLAAEEERHFDQFNKEIESIQKFGDNYLALQSMERSAMSLK
jgi:bacterioferritin